MDKYSLKFKFGNYTIFKDLITSEYGVLYGLDVNNNEEEYSFIIDIDSGSDDECIFEKDFSAILKPNGGKNKKIINIDLNSYLAYSRITKPNI